MVEDEAEAEAEPFTPIPEPAPASPFDLPGDWYVIHSYSGYENKVKANLETRTHSMHLEDAYFEVVIPMEDVVEIKNGKKVTVPRKMFPGYILCRMYLTDDSWYAVRNTPGVTGFVGSANKPVPLARREVEQFLGVQKEEEAKAPRFKPEWEMGDSVRVRRWSFCRFQRCDREHQPRPVQSRGARQYLRSGHACRTGFHRHPEELNPPEPSSIIRHAQRVTSRF